MSPSGSRSRTFSLLIAVLLATAAIVAGAGAARADDPVTAAQQYMPRVPVAGANDWECKPGAAHPRPVVLVHGTFVPPALNWAAMAPALNAAGYCVFALEYGIHQAGIPATGDIPTSAGQLATFVDGVLAATGAAKVDIVGHSQGGMMPRYYIRFLGGAAKVDDLVGLAPSNHGTDQPLTPITGAAGCVACDQQYVGSDFLRNLNAGHDTEPGVDYTVVETRYDEVVTPYTSAFLSGDTEHVTNDTVQDACPGRPVEHVLIAFDPASIGWVENALGRAGPGDPGYAPSCAGIPDDAKRQARALARAAGVPVTW